MNHVVGRDVVGVDAATVVAALIEVVGVVDRRNHPFSLLLSSYRVDTCSTFDRK